jgi:nucleolar protein 56
MQAISNIIELDRAANLLVKRLREWYGLYFPELSQNMESNEKFVQLVTERTKDDLIGEFKVHETMGAELKERDVMEFLQLAYQIGSMYNLREMHEKYLEEVMKEYCPNLSELAGVTIGAKLLELGKGLKNLALLPASTMQLLGAEKALFRHIKTGARSPKYGVIINHPLIQKCNHKDKGKAARALADKLSLCARLDYFKGEFKAKEFKKELERKFFS